MGQPERQTTLQWSVSREFFDEDVLRPDRVLKLASLSHEEHLKDKESAESIEMVNLNTKETPTPPSTPQGNS